MECNIIQGISSEKQGIVWGVLFCSNGSLALTVLDCRPVWPQTQDHLLFVPSAGTKGVHYHHQQSLPSYNIAWQRYSLLLMMMIFFNCVTLCMDRQGTQFKASCGITISSELNHSNVLANTRIFSSKRNFKRFTRAGEMVQHKEH